MGMGGSGWGQEMTHSCQSRALDPLRSVVSLWGKICRAGPVRELEPRQEA